MKYLIGDSESSRFMIIEPRRYGMDGCVLTVGVAGVSVTFPLTADEARAVAAGLAGGLNDGE